MIQVPFIAARNVLRNPTRSSIMVIAVAIATSLIIVFQSLISGFIFKTEDDLTDIIGKIVVRSQLFSDTNSIYEPILGNESYISLAKSEGVSYSVRSYASGLGSAGSLSTGVAIVALNPSDEENTTVVPNSVLRGDFVSDDDPKGVVIGRVLAQYLNISLGDEFVFLGSAYDGSFANEIYHIRGIFGPLNEESDRVAVFMARSEFQDLFRTEDLPHEIVFNMPSLELEPFYDKLMVLNAELGGVDEVLRWYEANPALNQMFQLLDGFVYLYVVIFGLAVAIGILNLMIISVNERVREYAIMSALGTRPHYLFIMTSLEALFVSTVGVIVGIVVAIPINAYIKVIGIDFSNVLPVISLGGVYFDPLLYGAVVPSLYITVPVSIMGIVLVTSLYPAWKVLRIDTVRGLQHG